MKRLTDGVRRAILVLLALLAGRSEAASPQTPSPAQAASRPWEFTDIGGTRRTIGWRAQDARGVFVFFFDLRSPDSVLALSFCDALAARAGDFGLSVVAIEASGRQLEELRRELQSFAAVYRAPSFPVIAGPDAAIAKLFGDQRAPTGLLLNSGGEQIARWTQFDPGVAVDLTRRVERLLRRGEGFFSPLLRDVGVSEAKERELGARATAAAAGDAVEIQPLGWGDRLPPLDFTDTTGRVGHWSWPAGGVIRVAFFWSATSEGATESLAFFDGLRQRAGGEFLEIIAVESTGISPERVRAALKAGAASPIQAIGVVADPERELVALFGAGNPLPQTFLIGGRGDVLYRAEGFGAGVRKALEEKIARAGRLAGLGLPPAPDEVRRDITAGGGEAPSIVRRLERDKELRFNLSRGDYFFSNGQYERSLLHYERYLELEPLSLHAVVRLAQSHDLLGDFARAREYWERVLAISPNHAEARGRLRQLGRAGLP